MVFDKLARDNNSSSTITIGGTADVTLPEFPQSGRGTGTTSAVIIFDGGVLRNSAASADYLGITTSAQIKNGGAKFNTAGGNITISHALNNFSGHTGTLTKEGSNTLTLTGANGYTSVTTVTGGTLVVNGSISSSLTTVESGATIGGSGTVGALTVTSGGYMNPGNSPGIFTVNGDYILNGQLGIEIESLTAGNGTGFHDQVVVNGTVTLGASSILNLQSFSGFTPVDGNLIFILLNDGIDPISGTFNGLAQGATVGNYLGYDWQISYVANSSNGTFTNGNDIALMAIPEPKAALLGALGVLLMFRRRR